MHATNPALHEPGEPRLNIVEKTDEEIRATAEPLWRDPTAVLVRRQRERRAVRLTGAVIDLLPSRSAPSIVPGADASVPAWHDRPRRLAI